RTEAGEVEPQDGDPALRELAGDGSRGKDVLAAREAMREQRVGPDGAGGQIEPRGEITARVPRERDLEAAGRSGNPGGGRGHGGSPSYRASPGVQSTPDRPVHCRHNCRYDRAGSAGGGHAENAP